MKLPGPPPQVLSSTHHAGAGRIQGTEAMDTGDRGMTEPSCPCVDRIMTAHVFSQEE